MNSYLKSGCIGCNIVDPNCDDAENYTEEIYLKNLENYSQYGVTHLEFSHVTVLDKFAAENIRFKCQCLGLIPWSLHSEHLNDLEDEDDYYKIEEHCAMIGEAMGISVMVCHLPNCAPRASDLERDKKILTNVADIARKHNIRLGIEPCWDNPKENDVDYIIKLVDSIDRQDVGITLDTGHVYCYIDHDVARQIRKAGHRIISLHLQDNYGKNDDHQMPGMGLIDWKSVISALKEVGYNGPLMMEMTGEGVKARRTIEALRNYDIEKEIICGSAYLSYLWQTVNY